ncbi:hypothetical protein CC85DRAFT_9547 [Cutaneotrichosporon oleaginosum]|uniref:Uncharacterized protein n=1 Tax=Cutaneotrichosporon oleaginosum TaxID=879819 RepID=A0A0J0XU17_9TREE|nr:uncharacterized protein CC85DRAFT_9547 [Cutaneotrichosporon oleaginosum]KLT44586.1 hypothetical protein CC85DRAFT_9547 [Cutaneotrichosporon oleaginosum]TXT13899.1 hypothetical protein COLE_00092 [Cutaneotrichosporon oleaginosum]
MDLGSSSRLREKADDRGPTAWVSASAPARSTPQIFGHRSEVCYARDYDGRVVGDRSALFSLGTRIDFDHTSDWASLEVRNPGPGYRQRYPHRSESDVTASDLQRQFNAASDDTPPPRRSGSPMPVWLCDARSCGISTWYAFRISEGSLHQPC